MKSVKFFLAAAAVLLAASCGRGGLGEGGLVTFDYSQMTEGQDTLVFSDLAEEPEFIALDSDTLDAFAAAKVLITEKYLVKDAQAILSKAPVRVFDRHTGRFICNVGHLGRGPGEYLNSSQTFVDEDGGRVWIMDAADRIKTYDLTSGKYLGDVPLAYKPMDEFGAGSASFMVDGRAGTLTVMTVPYEEDSCPAIAWCQDLSGKILWEIPEVGRQRTRTPSNTLVGTSFNIEGALDVSFESSGNWPDTLYVLKGDVLRPVFTVNTRSLKSGSSLKSTLLPGKVLSTLTEMQEYMPRIIIGVPVANVLTDLKSGESVSYPTEILNDFLGGYQGGYSIQCGYLVQSIPAEEFLVAAPQALEQGTLTGSAAKRVRAILSDLQPTDNDVLMLARLKD